jgi:hypothetical protein
MGDRGSTLLKLLNSMVAGRGTIQKYVKSRRAHYRHVSKVIGPQSEQPGMAVDTLLPRKLPQALAHQDVYESSNKR